jgi:hypothetical protein
MELGRLFTHHPASVGESYGIHLLRAGYFGSRMMLAGAACLVHAILPFVFVKTGSRAIAELNSRMVSNRHVPPRVRGEHAPG